MENEEVLNTDVDPAADPASASDTGSESGKTDTTPSATEDPKQSDLDAFKAGVESLKEDANAPTKETKDGDVASNAGSDGKGPGAKGADPSGTGDKQGVQAKKQPDAELEKEITGLNLKGKAADRFREMSGEIKTSRPIIETLKGLKITSQEQLNGILKDASAGLQWEKAVMDSTAQPQQLTSALQIIKAMNTNDPKLHRIALDAMLSECKVVAERLGVEVPGLTGDILDKYPDLKQAVDALDITRERAVELAQLRAGNRNYEQRDQQNVQAIEQRQQAEQAEQMERARIDDLSNTLEKNDPQFAAKFQTLQGNGTLAAIGQLPLQQRYAAVLQAYNAVQIAAPAQQAQQQRVRPSAVTNRGNNISSNGVARTDFKSDVEAFKFGVDSVSQR